MPTDDRTAEVTQRARCCPPQAYVWLDSRSVAVFVENKISEQRTLRVRADSLGDSIEAHLQLRFTESAAVIAREPNPPALAVGQRSPRHQPKRISQVHATSPLCLRRAVGFVWSSSSPRLLAAVRVEHAVRS